MKIAVAGAGYVGLVFGAVMASGRWGEAHEVVLVEPNNEARKAINDGEPLVVEPGLPDLINRGLFDCTLQVEAYGDEVHELYAESNVVVCAVGTPTDEMTGAADLSAVRAVADDFARSLRPGSQHVFVVKSTVPPGTCDDLLKRIEKAAPDNVEPLDFDVVSCPEFLAEGTAVQDMIAPDRIVLGSVRGWGVDVVIRMLEEAGIPSNVDEDDGRGQIAVASTARTSEMVKMASNATLAARITVANELAAISSGLDIDGHEVMRLVGLDQRIGSRFLRPGPGWGGSCFPKDLRSLNRSAVDASVSSRLLVAIETANLRHRDGPLNVLDREIPILEDKLIVVWGLSFKAGTPDIRDSAGIELIRKLTARRAVVFVHDPSELAVKMATDQGCSFYASESPMASVKNAQAIVVFNPEDPAYAEPDWWAIANETKWKCVVVDCRGAYERDDIVNAGLRYAGLWKPRKYKAGCRSTWSSKESDASRRA